MRVRSASDEVKSMMRGHSSCLVVCLSVLLAGCATGGGGYETVEGERAARIVELEKALAARPDDSDLHYELGNINFDQGYYAEAVTAYERVLELDPNMPNAWTNMGLSLRQLDQPEEALSAYQKALTFESEDLTTLRNMKVVVEILGRTELLVETTRKIAELSAGNSDAQAEYADLLFGLERYADAAAAYEDLLALKSSMVKDWYSLGLCYFNMSDWVACEKAWAEGLGRAPYHPSTNKGMAVLFWSKRQYERSWDSVYRCQRLGINLDPAFLDNLRRDSGKG